ncbi:hypothetical protein CAP35_11290 [Chitinophagaceae bacterium IBVUCB1]|nr:hypothetical protein CAP35_11290 [Chitinophagaceae bacterium IBVUCB1]
MFGKVKAYLKRTVNPGGTPRRMKEWMGAILLLHACGNLLPGKSILDINTADGIVLSAVFLVVIFSWSALKEAWQMPLCWLIMLSALSLHIYTANYHNINRADIITICAWAMSMLICERRGYMNFVYLMLSITLCLGSMGVSTVYNSGKAAGVTEMVVPLIIGIVVAGCNTYLLIIDFKFGEQKMKFFERHFDKIEELSQRLSRILMEEKPLQEVLWNVTKECIPLLDLDDFVIYLYDADKNKLVQVAAYGGKSATTQQIINPIEIPPGKGIVGKVFLTNEPILIEDTSQSKDYIVDDAFRMSELAVPISIGDEVLGVIDSEHPKKRYYQHNHLQVFRLIAAFCSIKIAKQRVEQKILEAEKQELEANKTRELEALKSKFITNISHDLKTPLSLILGPATQINNIAKDPHVKQQVAYILKNTNHLMAMVEQLLQLNHVDLGIGKLKPETIDITAMVKGIYEQYEPLAIETGITFTLDVPQHLTIVSDHFRLSQSIHNLLQNAFKHTPKDELIGIRVNSGAGLISIEIKDTGVGIPADEQEKIFERFYKIDVNNHKGTGIGLSLVKEYITQLGGKIAVKSEPAKGTVFSITMPVTSPDVNTPDAERIIVHTEVENEDKLPLMVVAEDHAELNAFISQAFESNGFKVMTAFDGKQALQLIQDNIPDIVITDLMMPNMNGEDLVNAVKNSDTIGHIPIIVLSAKGQLNSKVDLYQLGADNYLTKPFQLEELLAIADSTLKQRKRLRDSFVAEYLNKPVLLTNDTQQGEELVADNQVQQYIDYILEHLDRDSLNVNTMGKHFNLGRNRLQREIKVATGLTPVEFIRSVRLNEAQKMLQAGKRNISEIAYMTGFSNLSYFSRSYKLQFGIAPSEVQVASLR